MACLIHQTFLYLDFQLHEDFQLSGFCEMDLYAHKLVVDLDSRTNGWHSRARAGREGGRVLECMCNSRIHAVQVTHRDSCGYNLAGGNCSQTPRKTEYQEEGGN